MGKISTSTNPAENIASLQPFRAPAITKVLDDLQEQLSGSNLAFLFGAGCSVCAGLPTMPSLTKSVLEGLSKTHEGNILNALASDFNGKNATIEDYLSELIDHIAILQRRTDRGTVKPVAFGNVKCDLNEILKTQSEIKRIIKETIEQAPCRIQSHIEFVRTIHGTFQAGKDMAYHKVDYFTLNYDTLLEDALALERIPYVDGFQGGATGWWDVNELRRRDTSARVLKLHGSVDWRMSESDTFPRKIRPGLNVDAASDECLIWPAANKHRETQLNPYALLLDQLRETLNPRNDRNLVLTILGA